MANSTDSITTDVTDPLIEDQFRPSGRSNRSGRSQADHDVFEGLPIKQWRQSETTVGLPQVVGETKPGDNAWPELQMPRDSHLLSPFTQALLREARRPRLAKRKEPTDDEKGEDDEETAEKETQTGFSAKKWSHVPAHLEEPEREYLAKRRKGLPSLHTTLALQAAINIPALAATRKAKVMKADADGNMTVYEVLVPEGQVVEGEIQQDAEMADVTLERAAPGTIIDGVGIANAEGVIVANDLLQPQAPPRRRNMPPKRVKKGGPGRGRKKVMFTAEGQAAAASTPGGTAAVAAPVTTGGAAGEPMDVDAVQKDGEGDGDGDGEDGEGEGEDDDDDDDREEGEISDEEGGAEETPLRPTGSAIPSETNEPRASVSNQAAPEPIAEPQKTEPPAASEQPVPSPLQDSTMEDNDDYEPADAAPTSVPDVVGEPSAPEAETEAPIESDSAPLTEVTSIQESNISSPEKPLLAAPLNKQTSASPIAGEAVGSVVETSAVDEQSSAEAPVVETAAADTTVIEPVVSDIQSAAEAEPRTAAGEEATAIQSKSPLESLHGNAEAEAIEVTEEAVHKTAEDVDPTISAAAKPDDSDALSGLERALRDQEDGEGEA